MAKPVFSNKVEVLVEGKRVVLYEPQSHPLCNQVAYHQSKTPNLLMLGTRDTGKSLSLRWDAIIRCLTYPRFRALILRRTIPQLRVSHLAFIGHEMRMLGQPDYNQTTHEAKFHNGSLIQFSHCVNMKDVENYLSSEWDFIGYDELSSWPLEIFLQISAAARTSIDKPYQAVVRAGSNTLGIGSSWMRQWFVQKEVDYAEYPDYNPNDFEVQYSRLEGNKYADRAAYEKRLKNLPSHVRRSWLDLEFVIEGAYFTDFRRNKADDPDTPWHVIPMLPKWQGQSVFTLPWLSVYRALDWGYFPDPAVCLWIAVLPNKHEIVFKERTWRRTLAADVAKAIKKESEGLRIIETFSDPSMFMKTGQTPYSIGETFEQNGVPLTPSQNARELFGYAIHEHLNTIIDDHPQMQIVASVGQYGCPDLLRTLPLLQMDPADPRKIASGDDHYAVALAYFCVGMAVPSQDPAKPTTPFWMKPRKKWNPNDEIALTW